MIIQMLLALCLFFFVLLPFLGWLSTHWSTVWPWLVAVVMLIPAAIYGLLSYSISELTFFIGTCVLTWTALAVVWAFFSRVYRLVDSLWRRRHANESRKDGVG